MVNTKKSILSKNTLTKKKLKSTIKQLTTVNLVTNPNKPKNVPMSKSGNIQNTKAGLKNVINDIINTEFPAPKYFDLVPNIESGNNIT